MDLKYGYNVESIEYKVYTILIDNNIHNYT